MTQTVMPLLTKQSATGLTTNEAQARLKRGESNDYQPRVNRTYWDIFRDNVLNLFNIVLFTLLFIVLFYRDYGTVIFAGFSVVMNTFLGMIQEMQAKRRLDKLAALSQPKVQVLRDGALQEITVKAVVKDDILLLEPGTKAVVDGDVIQADTLEMDESLLTGESDSVFKYEHDEILSGSFCVAGTGLYRAIRVGRYTNINRITDTAKEYKQNRTPTQQRIDIVVELSVVLMFIFVPLLFISDLFVSIPPEAPLQAVRNAVVFVTTLVPQGLVLTAIVSLTIGAVKISQQQTLIQRVNAVESLANATVLCFDKTGTLTQNRLHVTQIIAQTDEDITQLLADYLANLAHLNRTTAAVQKYISRQAQPSQRKKLQERAFNSTRKWGAVQFEDDSLVMGAPERLLIDNHPELVTAQNYSKQGVRVLAFGRLSTLPDGDNIRGMVDLLALILVEDTLRDDINTTLDALRDEDIDLKVISGDSLETVKSVAQQAGMNVQEAYTGDELATVSDEDLQNIVRKANVFARIEPDIKRRIVRALQANKEYVAMVGDGVNDVPALKQADLAIVMNEGTQISKDVADIVLLNNALSTLPRAFAEGTNITQTIYATMRLFLTRGVFHVLLFIFVLFMALPFPITPIQISWATLGSVNIPAMLIAFGVLRPKKADNFRDDILDMIVIGGLVGAAMLTLIFVTTYFGTNRDLDIARSAVTVFVVLFNSYVVMTIMGVDFYEPRSFLKYWRIVALMTALTVGTIWAMYISPTTYEFTPVGVSETLWIFWLITALFSLSLPLFSQFKRHRYLVARMWRLFERDIR